MLKLTSPSVATDLMARYGFHTVKSFGQNFLCDEHYAGAIVDSAEIAGSDTIIEIGPGIGTLTQLIAEKAGRVFAIEIDKKLIPILKETLSDFDNVTVINKDVLDIDFKAFFSDGTGNCSRKIVSNLPYYITTPVLMRFIEEDINFESIVLMMQDEVTERLVAKPGSKDYGAVAVMLQCKYNIEPVLKVPSSVFIPRPQVNSAVIKLTPKKDCRMPSDEKVFRTLVKGSFTQRRKTLLNSLASIKEFTLTKDEINEILAKVNISPAERCEKLTIESFMDISDEIALRRG